MNHKEAHITQLRRDYLSRVEFIRSNVSNMNRVASYLDRKIPVDQVRCFDITDRDGAVTQVNNWNNLVDSMLETEKELSELGRPLPLSVKTWRIML